MAYELVRRYAPRLAGANPRDQLIAGLGALIGIGVTALVSAPLSPWPAPMILAPLGASAVLLFAVPSSPLAQPWSVVGGNSLSMLCGAVIVNIGWEPAAAAGVAVGCAIVIMSALRCLHPPGGAMALSAVLAGMQPVANMVAPAFLGSLVLVISAWLFHRISGHRYPHRKAAPAARPSPGAVPPATRGILMSDVDQAVEDLGEAFDVSRADLLHLFERAEAHAIARRDAALRRQLRWRRR